MIRRYVVMAAVPELRPEPGPLDVEQKGQEVEALFTIENYWTVVDLLQNLSYERSAGSSGDKYWKNFVKIMKISMTRERDRVWFAKNIA